MKGEGQRQGLGSMGTPGPRPRTGPQAGPRGGRGRPREVSEASKVATGQTLSHPPGEGLGTGSDEGWGWPCALPAQPAQLPSAPLAAGVAVFSGTPRDRLLGNGVAMRGFFLQADQGGPVPQAAECGPSPAPSPPSPKTALF